MILLIDNYDSFVHNLARYLRQLGQETVVARNDSMSLAEIERMEPDAIVISPGPCSPSEAGLSVEIVKHFSDKVPILGICLGHQAIAAAFGGEVFRTQRPVHGQTRDIIHDQRGVFRGLPNPLTAGLYHSLAVDPSSLPEELEVTAQSGEEIVMGIRHRSRPIVGLQFHPESILTRCGHELLAGFLQIAGVARPAMADFGFEELREVKPVRRTMPATPVTF